MAWWSADSRSRKLDRQPFLRVEVAAVVAEQADDVVVGDGVVLARLHARLALAELRAADAQQLEDPAAEQACRSPRASRFASHATRAGALR